MILQLIKQLGIAMDNPLACQSQLPRLNLSDYKDQGIQTERLKIHIYPYLLPASAGTNTPPTKSRFSNSQNTYHIMLVVFLC